MPRLPGVNYPNAVYHVTARGNGRGTIFFEDADRHRFLRQLSDSLEAGFPCVMLHRAVLLGCLVRLRPVNGYTPHIWQAPLGQALAPGTHVIEVRAEDDWWRYEGRRLIRVTAAP